MKKLIVAITLAAVMVTGAIRPAQADTYWFLFSGLNLLAGPFATYNECSATMMAYGVGAGVLSCQQR